MTVQLAIRVDDDRMTAIDELAAREGVSRTEIVRRAVDQITEDTDTMRLRREQDRVAALLGRRADVRWATFAETYSPPDDRLASDLDEVLGADQLDPL